MPGVMGAGSSFSFGGGAGNSSPGSSNSKQQSPQSSDIQAGDAFGFGQMQQLPSGRRKKRAALNWLRVRNRQA